MSAFHPLRTQSLESFASNVPMELTAPNRLARLSVLNSSLLPITAGFEFNVTFWVLVCTNFVLFHAVWISQIRHLKDWRTLDPRPFFWALVAFAALGNLSLLLWGRQLLGMFPTYSA